MTLASAFPFASLTVAPLPRVDRPDGATLYITDTMNEMIRAIDVSTKVRNAAHTQSTAARKNY